MKHILRFDKEEMIKLINQECNVPVIFSRNYSGINKESTQIFAATDFGGLFIDGLGDGAGKERLHSAHHSDMATVMNTVVAH